MAQNDLAEVRNICPTGMKKEEFALGEHICFGLASAYQIYISCCQTLRTYVPAVGRAFGHLYSLASRQTGSLRALSWWKKRHSVSCFSLMCTIPQFIACSCRNRRTIFRAQASSHSLRFSRQCNLLCWFEMLEAGCSPKLVTSLFCW